MTEDDVVKLPLQNGHFALVDRDDATKVAGIRWYAHKGSRTWYARGRVDGRRIFMHVLLAGKRGGKTIDHKNGNGLDNRRCNLRFASHSQQARNRHRVSGTSKFKGVARARRQRRWVATIFVGGKNRHLGYFLNEEDAARAYDLAADLHFGEFASLNFPVRGAQHV